MRTKRTSTVNGAGPELKGPVLDVLKSLLRSGRGEDVATLVEKLVPRNSELEQRLAQVLSRGYKNEGVSTAQLKLFVDTRKRDGRKLWTPADFGVRVGGLSMPTRGQRLCFSVSSPPKLPAVGK